MARVATIRDVAAAARVSVSTVSLALNKPSRVSPTTRQRVMEAADGLGFAPKAAAAAQARRRTPRIGVIGPFASYPAAAERLAGILTASDLEGSDIVVFDQPSASDSPTPLLAALPRSGRLDALIVVSLPLDDALVARAEDLQLPLALVDTHHDNVDAVLTDDAAGGRLAAQHLLERGHRRIAFLGDAQRSSRYRSPAQRRLHGMRTALTEAGAQLHRRLEGTCQHDLDAARTAAATLLALPDRPTAIFASDDLLAAGVLRAAADAGLSTPGDIAVIGYDDGPLAAALDLTTIRQPLRESGRSAIELLQQRLQAPPPRPPRKTTLQVQLVVRGTA